MTALAPTMSRRHERAAIRRLAQRTSRRGGWRNLLVVSLIALAVAISVVAAVGARSSRVTAEDYLNQTFGARADVVIFDDPAQVRFEDLSAAQQDFFVQVRGSAPPPLQDPPILDVVADVAGDVPVLSYTQRWSAALEAQILDLDISDPLAAGLVVVDGPAPAAGEALVSGRLLDRLGVGMGDEIDLPEVGAVRVVGTAESPLYTRDEYVVVTPGSLGRPIQHLVQAGDQAASLATAINAGGDPFTAGFRHAQHRADSGFVGAGDTSLSSNPSVVGSVVAALLLVQVGFIAAAAFATGTRRRIRQFGLLGAAGASPSQLARLVRMEALVLGGIAVVAGAALGLLVVGFGRDALQLITNVRIDSLTLRPLDILGPALVGLVAAVVAASWPARSVAQTSTVTALAGRVPLGTLPRWAPVASVTATGAGLLLLSLLRTSDVGDDRQLMMLGAVVLTALGAASLGLPLVGLLGRYADRLGLRLRLAVRDAARQRTRSAATVAALCVVMMIPALLMTSIQTDEARFAPPDGYVPTILLEGPYLAQLSLPVDPTAATAFADDLPVEPTAILELDNISVIDERGLQLWATVLPLDDIPGMSRFFVGGAPLVLATPQLMTQLGLDGEQRAHLASGGVVDVAEPGTLNASQRAATERPGRIQVVGDDGEPFFQQDVDVLVAEAPTALGLRVTLLGGDLAEQIPSARIRTSSLLVLPRELTPSELDQVYDRAADPLLGNVAVNAGGFRTEDPRTVGPIAVAVTAVIVLIVVGMAAALAATESDRDLQVMDAVGGAPTLRGELHGLQAAYLSAMAALIAIPTALLLYRVAAGGDGFAVAMAVPWGVLIALAVGVPAVVGGVMRTIMRPVAAVGRRIA